MRGQGRVVELGFQAIGLQDGPTEWRPKIRKARQGGCLRDDLFQQGGSHNIADEISPYLIRVRWDSDNAGNPITDSDLLLPGTIALVDSAATLSHAIIRGPADRTTFRFLTEQLISHADL